MERSAAAAEEEDEMEEDAVEVLRNRVVIFSYAVWRLVR